MGNNPSHFQGAHLPVEQVSWDDCQEFLHKLSELDGKSCRLPTEAEWEYACRAGTTTRFFFGDTISANQTNFDGNGNNPYGGNGQQEVYRGKTTPVGGLPPNAWGLYDMHGNVDEWCADWYGDYPRGDVIDPQGSQRGNRRVMRGGWYGSPVAYIRSDFRNDGWPTFRADYVGFRALMDFP